MGIGQYSNAPQRRMNIVLYINWIGMWFCETQNFASITAQSGVSNSYVVSP